MELLAQSRVSARKRTKTYNTKGVLTSTTIYLGLLDRHNECALYCRRTMSLRYKSINVEATEKQSLAIHNNQDYFRLVVRSSIWTPITYGQARHQLVEVLI